MKHLIRVGVLRGGPSNEYDVSLNSGGNVLAALRKHFEHKYHPKDVFIDRQGNWHIDGLAVDPSSLHSKIDVAFNALHGSYGEDGKVQAILAAHGIPFTGSDALSSAVGMNKILSKKSFAAHGIKSPYWKEVQSSSVIEDSDAVARELFTTFILPAVIKPVSSGSSVGVSVVRDFAGLSPALLAAAAHGDIVLVEEFIPGIEATCGVIEGFRNHDLYALPPVEIRPHSGFFDFEAKYQGKSQEIVPATFAESIKKSIEELAGKVHRALGLKHYSRSDFIIHPRRGIYVLEVNTLPGLTDESLMPKSLRAVGSDTHELIDHLIMLALKGRNH
ncbi:MAG: D-alanine--D-alanine ligase [Candidatus Pacebacteria bacterium]|nr:D-alanine--D-alanine ligase [Candidatus Paceibacterota bacterium]